MDTKIFTVLPLMVEITGSTSQKCLDALARLADEAAAGERAEPAPVIAEPSQMPKAPRPDQLNGEIGGFLAFNRYTFRKFLRELPPGTELTTAEAAEQCKMVLAYGDKRPAYSMRAEGWTRTDRLGPHQLQYYRKPTPSRTDLLTMTKAHT